MSVCDQLDELLHLVEEGQPWPTSSPHARTGFLQKDGTEVGQITNYRLLSIATPIYRCWEPCGWKTCTCGFSIGHSLRCLLGSPVEERWTHGTMYSPSSKIISGMEPATAEAWLTSRIFLIRLGGQ